MPRSGSAATPPMTLLAKAVVLAGWVLLMSGPSGGWRPVGTYEQEWLCAHVRADAIDRAAVAEIGSALASQPRDNPLRQEADRRAAKQPADLYRRAGHGAPRPKPARPGGPPARRPRCRRRSPLPHR